MGNAMTTIVGRVKKEIVYHGDVLNATSRIQTLCNHYDQRLIISEELRQKLHFDPLGEIRLRGKTVATALLGVAFQ